MAHNFRNCIAATIILILFGTTTAIGASLTVVPSIDSTFTVQGVDLVNVGGMELSLSYASSSLATPKVSEGSLISGALMTANTANPGSIKVAIIATTAISGSGPVVVINFAPQTDSVSILSFSSNAIDSKGIQIPVQSSVLTGSSNIGSGFFTTPGVPFSQPPTPTIATTTSTPPIPSVTSISTPPIPSVTSMSTPPIPETTTANATAFTAISGTMPATSELLTKSDSKPPETKSSDTPDTSAQAPPSAPLPTEQPQASKPVEPQTAEMGTTTPYKGVLEYFMAYKGDKSPLIFTALFDKQIAPNIRQEPAIATSDGKTPLKVLIKLGNASDKSPNFALNGAKLVSLNKDNSSTWIIEALPQIGISQASLTIMTDSSTIEYPLTLAPPVESVSTSMADFVIFLNDSGAASPKFDLNKDKKHDYLDDFIYTANYILKKNAAEKTKK